MIQIYCGDGKGKTTAAIGLAIRVAGCGKKVLFARFLKNERSGELRILDTVPEIRVLHLPRSYGFFQTLNEKEQREVRQQYQELWKEVQRRIQEEFWDLLVLDEFMAAYRYRMIEPEEAMHFLKYKPEHLEVVLTGRDPAEEILKYADYISEIRKVRHPFDRGVGAREGIEF